MTSPQISRRNLLKTAAASLAVPGAIFSSGRVFAEGSPKAAIAIGKRRELFVDDYLIDELRNAEFKMQLPKPRDVVIVCDAPWEGNISAYYTIFADDDRFRMYYRGAHYDVATKKPAHAEFACYAESKDGLHWEKPELGLHEYNGSKANNIVQAGEGTHNFTPFKDENPNCAPDARYKSLATAGGGLKAYKSPDGIHWTPMSNKPVITKGAFDSQNLAFWYAPQKRYLDFHRTFVNRVRDIMTCSSEDFLNWTEPELLTYGDAPTEHLYTNAIQPYHRAPHLFIGFPTRFQPKNQQVEPILMTSRDGKAFHRWSEPLIPITAPEDRDGNRSNYMARGLLQLPGQDRELSVFGTEAYYEGPGSRVRRFTFRTDGFVAVHATTGELITKPFTFEGKTLGLNYVAGAKGSLRVEVQNANGEAIPGLTLNDCSPMTGDEIDQAVTWKENAALAALSGKPVRLRFEIKNADLFAMQFSG